MEQVRVYAPATVANVACGFDIFGFAVDRPGDEVVLTKKDTPGIIISEITGDEGRLPLEVHKNTAGIAIQKYLEHIGRTDQGFTMALHKDMPLGSGLGSSAASAVAGVFAANELMGKPLSQKELLPFAMEGERVACGSAHADNVGPSLLGGFVIIRSYNPLDIIEIKVPEDLFATIVHPQVEVNTKDARSILEREIPLSKTIEQMGNVAGLTAGLLLSDYELISRSLEDVIIEPIRSILIPQFKEVKSAAMAAGALGCSISGSGPSLFALSRGLETAEKVAVAMTGAFKDAEIESEAYVSGINQRGPVVS
ncbi:homoserine kinase [Sandaracinomonas limnophila]|uniref:Homoserine kinase n=1 Tax=Sandaracinomonas limnophila TaxID=1862386 RepID=A0A437PW25_9BACT|nr:homoserine kinase [Sandaracinomonas limnophila]RVU26465.1 homoserine kinase [Sandaracinomonas limnophila]